MILVDTGRESANHDTDTTRPEVATADATPATRTIGSRTVVLVPSQVRDAPVNDFLRELVRHLSLGSRHGIVFDRRQYTG